MTVCFCVDPVRPVSVATADFFGDFEDKRLLDRVQLGKRVRWCVGALRVHAERRAPHALPHPLQLEAVTAGARLHSTWSPDVSMSSTPSAARSGWPPSVADCAFVVGRYAAALVFGGTVTSSRSLSPSMCHSQAMRPWMEWYAPRAHVRASPGCGRMMNRR